MNATIDGDMEVVSTLISDGVDMNAILDEVYTVLMSVMIASYRHNVEPKQMLRHDQFQKSADRQLL